MRRFLAPTLLTGLALTTPNTAESSWTANEPQTKRELRKEERQEAKQAKQETAEWQRSFAEQHEDLLACAEVHGQQSEKGTRILNVQGRYASYNWYLGINESDFENGDMLIFHDRHGYMELRDHDADGFLDYSVGNYTYRPGFDDDTLYPCRLTKEGFVPSYSPSECSMYTDAFRAGYKESLKICEERTGEERIQHDPFCSVMKGSRADARANYDQALGSIVQLFSTDSDGNVGKCSGTFIGDDLILTAGHCVLGSKSIQASWQVEGKELTDELYVAPAALIDLDYDPNTPSRDIALLQVPSNSPIAQTQRIDFGADRTQLDDLRVIGHPKWISWAYFEAGKLNDYLPLGLEESPELTDGLLFFKGGECFKQGVSGGPLFDDNGVYGVASATHSFLNKTGVAVDLAPHQEWLEEKIAFAQSLPAMKEGEVKRCQTVARDFGLTVAGKRSALLPSEDCVPAK